MTISKILITGRQTYLIVRRSYATGSKLVEATRDNDTAGFDLTELYKNDEKGLNFLWKTLQDTWLTLYNLNIPIATTINGSCPGGGCLLAISTEYRVFVKGKHTIGLNETDTGIPIPKWFKHLYISLLGDRQAELALLKGSLFTPEEALQIKLVDELATNKPDAIEKCKNYILLCNCIPNIERTVTKLEMRNSLIQWMKENKEEIDQLVDYVMLPKVQLKLKFYIDSLKKKQ
ncbi:enoyl-CoA delta isomerase 1, mitochondrial-like isoform X2 [Anoplolepis gracilipes]|uniref:enoyl-CoA delta isomerase 1, mitochondrial-like isoform X2 n=1 Tax=Anoplolepis gracilipes TaxID=354296 RepID=UPI003B9E28DB